MLLFRLLGAVEVEDDRGTLRLGGAKQRALLALLSLHANEVLSRDLLIDQLWVRSPRGAAHALEAHVSTLRKALRAGGDGDVLLTRPGGYLLSVEPDQVDVLQFEQLLEEGRRALAAGEPESAEKLLSDALSHWRGRPLADIAFEPVALAETGRLEQLRLDAVEARAEARLALGFDAEVVHELEPLVRDQPLRERLRGQLMLALYRAGRQADALAVYQEGRRRLVDELGIEPGSDLQQLQRAVLHHAGELDRPDDHTAPTGSAPESSATAPAVVREQRKVVSVVFCDVGESAVVREHPDPEALRVLLARCFERVQSIVERFGGTVERFVGDTAIAVFGVPAVHEDDALRAVHAAAEIRDALRELGVEARIGADTGEVVTGTDQGLAVGEVVHSAAGLQQEARPGEVLLGKETLALVESAVEADRVERPAHRGSSEPPSAFRLRHVCEAPNLRRESRFVGRERELALLGDAWQRVRAERCCEPTTIVGEAGVGKTRLVAEFLSRLEATVVRGRCLPYGDGITYWPVVEALRQLGVMPTDQVAAAAIGSLLDETVDVTADEIAWAVRKTFEHAATEAPLVVVFDDIHHGEQTFLDLIEHVALLTSDAPILLVCMARPELGERRPGWPVALQLAPLDDDEVEQLIPERITGALRREIVRAAGGNPLFVVEMLAIADETSGEAVVPPTLRALLGARLDRLDSGERDVLQRGAVEGEIFHGGAALALSTGDPSPARHLTALVRKNLIRPEASQLSGEDAFRFCHLLMRDTAYDALPKATRAELHERFAGWLEERGAGLVDLDQILGYHLEQAVRYREELGLPDDTGLRTAARRRLRAAGRRAYRTQDYGATIRLLERAAALLPADEFDLGIELELFRARFWTGKDEAFRQAGVFAEHAAGAGNRVGELCGRIQQSLARSWLEPRGELGRLAGLVEQALPVFEAADDDVALCLGHNAFAFVLRTRAQLDRAVDEYERAAEFAARAGLDDRFVHERSLCRFNGTTPASELLAWQDGLNERDRREWEVRQNRAVATGMLGRIDEARAQLSELQAELAEQRATMVRAVIIGEAGVDIEFLAGDYAAAAALAEESCTLCEELGEEASLWGYAAYLALAYCDLGRLEEADAWASRAAAADTIPDPWAMMWWRQARAKVLARRGDHAEAERVAREAVAIGERTDALDRQASVHAGLAEVLFLAGRTQEAAEAFEQALARYERKGNLVMADRMRVRLAEIATPRVGEALATGVDR